MRQPPVSPLAIPHTPVGGPGASSGLTYHAFIKKEEAAVSATPVDPHKCLDYSPKVYHPHVQLTPAPVYTHSVPISVQLPSAQTPLAMSVNSHPDYVSPIQRLQTTAQQDRARPISDYERKENVVDLGNRVTYVEKHTRTEKPTALLPNLPTADTITAAAPLTSAHITSKSIPRPEDIVRTFRPNSAHNKDSGIGKSMTGRILSPE